MEWHLIDIDLLFAGCMGGLVHACNEEKATPWEIIRFIIVGGLTANFSVQMAFIAVTSLGQFQFADWVAAFWIGMSGKKICYHAEGVIGSWKPFGKDKS
jgi:uncharacterized membrane protein